MVRKGDVSAGPSSPVLEARAIRGVETSLALVAWRSDTVVTSYYLNEVCFELEDVSSLRPFIAVGQGVKVLFCIVNLRLLSPLFAALSGRLGSSPPTLGLCSRMGEGWGRIGGAWFSVLSEREFQVGATGMQ